MSAVFEGSTVKLTPADREKKEGVCEPGYKFAVSYVYPALVEGAQLFSLHSNKPLIFKQRPYTG